MDKEIAIALGEIKERMNELGRRIDYLAIQRNEERKADIDYLAMMTDVDMEQDKEDMV